MLLQYFIWVSSGGWIFRTARPASWIMTLLSPDLGPVFLNRIDRNKKNPKSLWVWVIYSRLRPTHKTKLKAFKSSQVFALSKARSTLLAYWANWSCNKQSKQLADCSSLWSVRKCRLLTIVARPKEASRWWTQSITISNAKPSILVQLLIVSCSCLCCQGATFRTWLLGIYYLANLSYIHCQFFSGNIWALS